jgi:hypothetical protein
MSPRLNRVAEKSRAEMLAEIAGLPPSAFINSALAAAYIGTTPSVLYSWRSQQRGPRYHGAREFIRYKIADLDQWMAARANETAEGDLRDRIWLIARRVSQKLSTGPRHDCAVCGHQVEDPESIERGVCADCWPLVLNKINSTAREGAL